MSALLRRFAGALGAPIRALSTTPSLSTFWERDDKGGYRDDRLLPPLGRRLRQGLVELRHEVALWRDEVRRNLEHDPIWFYRRGEVDVVWRFEGGPKGSKGSDPVEGWVATSDSDNGEGYSRCSFETDGSKAVFRGTLDKRAPMDGRAKRAGYCNVRTLRARKSFKRETHLDWSNYNMLVMRVRGDGRSYLLNINTRGYYDVTWNDNYHFVLFTRGGPHWQIARIPFSKFYMASKGRIQDIQYPIPLNKVTTFGITAAEPYPGDFSLEIDYVGLEYDPNHTESSAYETYQTDKFIAQT